MWKYFYSNFNLWDNRSLILLFLDWRQCTFQKRVCQYQNGCVNIKTGVSISKRVCQISKRAIKNGCVENNKQLWLWFLCIFCNPRGYSRIISKAAGCGILRHGSRLVDVKIPAVPSVKWKGPLVQTPGTVSKRAANRVPSGIRRLSRR
jgi:hypothetical protein